MVGLGADSVEKAMDLSKCYLKNGKTQDQTWKIFTTILSTHCSMTMRAIEAKIQG